MYKYFHVPAGHPKILQQNLLLTCGANNEETTKRVVYLLSRIFVLLLFGYQQAIRKYLNTENSPIYGSIYVKLARYAMYTTMKILTTTFQMYGSRQ